MCQVRSIPVTKENQGHMVRLLASFGICLRSKLAFTLGWLCWVPGGMSKIRVLQPSQALQMAAEQHRKQSPVHPGSSIPRRASAGNLQTFSTESLCKVEGRREWTQIFKPCEKVPCRSSTLCIRGWQKIMLWKEVNHKEEKKITQGT